MASVASIQTPMSVSSPERAVLGFAGALGHVVAAAVRGLARRYQEMIAMDHLGAMNDAMLKDLGIARSEIELAVRGKVPGRKRGGRYAAP
jgi:uncharacterized protein YjiS (DUF1127 family)